MRERNSGFFNGKRITFGEKIERTKIFRGLQDLSLNIGNNILY